MLVYSAICSMDLFTADERGDFGWAMPDEELHALVNDLERPVQTYVHGRRMHEIMGWWDDPSQVVGEPEVLRDYSRIWQSADKVVVSTTLSEVSSPRTTLRSSYDPGWLRELCADRVVSIGGPTLAAHALRDGLVDQVHLFAHPVVIGSGLAALPAGLQLEVVEVTRLGSGVVHTHYVPATA